MLEPEEVIDFFEKYLALNFLLRRELEGSYPCLQNLRVVRAEFLVMETALGVPEENEELGALGVPAIRPLELGCLE